MKVREPSSKALHMSKTFLAGMVHAPSADTTTSQTPTISTSKSVPVIVRLNLIPPDKIRQNQERLTSLDHRPTALKYL